MTSTFLFAAMKARVLRFGVIALCSGVILFGAGLATIHAQTKVAYLDASKLLKRMQEAKDAETRINQLIASWTKEASDLQNEIDRKQLDFERRKLIMTDPERASTQLDLTNLRKRLDDFRHSKFDENGGELYVQQQQLMKPAYDKLSNAIKDVAAELSFDYVIDRSSHDVVLLYTNSKYDLTIPVARKLGIENEILSTPLVSKPGANGKQPGTQPAPGQPGSGGLAPGQIPISNPQIPGLTGQTIRPDSTAGGVTPNQTPTPPQKH